MFKICLCLYACTKNIYITKKEKKETNDSQIHRKKENTVFERKDKNLDYLINKEIN